MTVVQGTALDSAKIPIPYTQIQITLVTGTPNGPGYTSLGELYGTHETTSDNKGAWSIDLTPTSQVTPANTYYQVQEGLAISIIQVPASGGPYEISTLLVTQPPASAAMGITGEQIAANGTVAGVRPEVNLIAGSGIGVSAVDNASANRVDVTLTSFGGVSPASTVQPGTSYGLAAAVGTDVTYAREDHLHGTPGLATAAPTGSGPGDSAAVGTATTPARADHLHGREGFGAVTALTAFNTSSANGSAASVSHSDHVHGAPALPAASTSAAGIVQFDGTATDIQALGTQAAGNTGKAADAGHVHPTTGLVLATPADGLGLGLLTALPTASGYSVAQPSGLMTCCLVTAEKTQSISILGVLVTLGGVTGSGANGLAIYTEAGVLIDQTGDMTTAMSSAQFAEGNLSQSRPQTAGVNYYLCSLTHFSGTQPKFAATGTSSSPNLPVLNGHYLALYLNGQASFPLSFTPSGLSINSGHYIMYAR